MQFILIILLLIVVNKLKLLNRYEKLPNCKMKYSMLYIAYRKSFEVLI